MLSKFSLLLYNISIHLYYLLIYLAAFFQPKARLWIEGRENWANRLQKDLASNTKPLVWVHCASLGEFEQGRPVIERIKKQYPNYAILLTFFSPSGYEVRKKYQQVDHVCYLPLDTAQNAQQFIHIVQPKIVIFIKYEFWYHYLHQLHQQQIPSIVVAAIFREKQIFFSAYGQLFRQLLSYFSHIFVQNQASAKLLKNINITQVSIAKDTRFDRVFENSQQVKQLQEIATFKGERRLLIAGSTWPRDEKILADFINQAPENWCFIIAPHEIKSAQIAHFQHLLKKSNCKYSEFQINLHSKKTTLIIDNIGLLSSLYQYGDYAYIGGGFGNGIHNILEAAVFGTPLFFGTNYQRFKEAVDLVAQKGAFVIQSVEDLKNQIAIFEKNTDLYKKTSENNQKYIQHNKGGTDIVMDYIRQFL